MKHVTWILGVLLGALWASSWWAAAVFGTHPVDDFPRAYLDWLWAVPALITLFASITHALYYANLWEEEQKEKK